MSTAAPDLTGARAAAPLGPGSRFRRSRALVIGVDAYDPALGVSPLRSAVRDATEIGRILRAEHGFQVDELLDVTRGELRARLEGLAAEIGKDDRLLVYFAGHGLWRPDGGPGAFLLLRDAKLRDQDTFLPMNELHDGLVALSCRHALVVLDCCFAGAFRWASTRIVRDVQRVSRQRYDRFVESAAWQVIASAAADQEAYDALGERGESGGSHSPFAAALIDGLRGKADFDGDGLITATELYLYAGNRVREATDARARRQSPGLFPLRAHDHGEFVFQTPGKPLDLPPAEALTLEQNPYRGLRPFEEEHRKYFFGRNRVIFGLAKAVLRRPLTVVTGPSGCGKSSVVRAGLLPMIRLRQKAEDPDDRWRVVGPLRPRELPADPLPPPADHGKTLIVIDQLEEALALDGAAQRAYRALLDQVAERIAAAPDRIRVVVTVRSDLEPLLRDGPLASRWTASRFVVPPMTQDEIRAAIERPADARDMYFEPSRLVDQITNEVVQMPGALPLLSFTLSELYRTYCARGADDRALRATDYEALGGVASAVTRRANQELAALAKEDPRYATTIRHVILRMVDDLGGEPVRRRALLTELSYADSDEDRRVATVITRYADARLLVRDARAEGGAYVEPAHDVLISGWDQVRRWLADLRQERPLCSAIADAAQTWIDRKRDRSFLWHSDPRLPQAREVGARERHLLNAAERDFVTASLARRTLRRWRTTGVVAAVIVALAGVALVALRQADRASRNAREAERQRASAVARGIAAQSRVAFDELGPSVQVGGLLAVEALRRRPGVESFDVAQYALGHLLVPLRVIDHPGVEQVAVSGDGELVVSRSRDYLLVSSAQSGAELGRLPLESDDSGLPNDFVFPFEALRPVISPDGKHIALILNDDALLWHWQVQRLDHLPLADEIAFDFRSTFVVLSTEAESRIEVYLAETGQRLWGFGETYYISDFATSADGSILASASGRSVSLRGLLEQRDPITFEVGDFVLGNLSISPSSTLLAVGSRSFEGRDPPVELWTIGREPALVRTFPAPGSPTLATDELLIIRSLKGLSAWDIETGLARWQLTNFVGGLFPAPDARFVAHLFPEDEARLLAPDGELVAQLPADGEIYSVAFDHASTFVAVASGDGFVRLFKLEAPLREMKLARSMDTWTPSPRRDQVAFTTSMPDVFDVEVWDTRGDRLKAAFDHVAHYHDLATSPDGSIVAVSGHGDWGWETRFAATDSSGLQLDLRMRLVLSGMTSRLRGMAHVPSEVTLEADAPHRTKPRPAGTVDIAPDIFVGDVPVTYVAGEIAAMGPTVKRTVSPASLVPRNGGTLEMTPEGPSPEALPYANVVITNARQAAFSIGDIVMVWDLGGNREIARFVHGFETTSEDGVTMTQVAFAKIALAPGGGTLLTLTRGGVLRLWDVARRTPTILAGGLVMNDVVSELAVNPAGMVAQAAPDGVKLFSLDSPKSVRTLRGGARGCLLSFDVSGALLLRACPSSGGQLVTRWDAATGQELGGIQTSGHITSMDVDPSGGFLVTAHGDGVARLWSLETGTEVGRVRRDAGIQRAAFVDEGRSLLSPGRGDRDIELIPWISEDVAIAICSRLFRNLWEDEWRRFFAEPYQATCPGLPSGPRPARESSRPGTWRPDRGE
jgi:WD40 repeat protein